MSKTEVFDKDYLQARPKSKFEKAFDWLGSDRSAHSIWLIFLVLIAVPFLFFPIYVVVSLLLRYHAKKLPDYPFFAPIHSRIKVDRFNVDPKKGKEGQVYYKRALGISYFGNETTNNTQVWMTDSVLRQHLCYMAATGGGKTFTISGVVSSNALCWGAGYLYVDAKADNQIIQMHQTILWRFNRIDDFFLLNYIRGSRNKFTFAADRTSNTYNLVEAGTAAQNTELMKSLMQGDDDIWAKRADSLLASIIKPACYLRDINMLDLSVLSLMDYLTVETAGKLLSNQHIPESETKQLYGFMKTLPGMTDEFFNQVCQGKTVNSTQVYDQFGFASMQIILVFNRLAGDYGDIFGCTVGEIDIEAVVLQDRIMMGLLPSLEGSTDSVAAMGRIILAARKGMMGRSLGERWEGSVKENIDNRATNAPYPFQNVMDEVGAIFSEGEGAASAMARGIGYSLYYCSQDLPAMEKLSDKVAKEVKTVMGNTVTKMAGRILEQGTFEVFKEVVGDKIVWQRDSTEIEYRNMSGNQYTKESRGTFKDENRLDRRKLAELNEGEIYMTAVDRLHRVDGPVLHPKKLKTLAINDFVIPPRPKQDVVDQLKLQHTLLLAEYDLIISGKQALNKPTPPVLNDIGDLATHISKIKPLLSNRSQQLNLAFTSFVRASLDELNELSSSKDMYYERVQTHGNDSQYDRLKGVPVGSQDIRNDGQETTQTDSVLDTPSSSTRTSFNVSTVAKVSEKSSEDSGAIGSKSDIEKGEASKKISFKVTETSIPGPTDDHDSADNMVQPVDDQTSQSRQDTPQPDEHEDTPQPQEHEDTQKTSILDAYFEHSGITTDSMVAGLTQLAALAERHEKLEEKVESGSINRTEAHTAMLSNVSEEERAFARAHAERAVNEVYDNTTHPTDPTPVQNKKMTLKILRKIHDQLSETTIE